MRILVTGGAGYIGSHTVKALIEKGHDPVIIDNLVYGHKFIVKKVLKVPLIIGQIGNFEVLKKILLGQHSSLIGTIHQDKVIEAVMHFGAYSYVEESVLDPLKYYKNNLLESIILLDALAIEMLSQRQRIIYPSQLFSPALVQSTATQVASPLQRKLIRIQ